MELIIPVIAAGVSYGVTWLVDRRQKPALVAGGGVGALATALVIFL